MPIRHDQIDLGGSSPAQIVQQADPSVLAFLGAGPQCQHLFVSCQIHPYCCQNDGGIGLVAMTNAEMHAIQVQDTPVLLESARARQQIVG